MSCLPATSSALTFLYFLFSYSPFSLLFSSHLPFHFLVAYVSSTFTCFHLPCPGCGFRLWRHFTSQPFLAALLPRHNFPAAPGRPPTSYLFLRFLVFHTVGRGAYKSLTRTTSRCRRTESVVSLERGVCSCAELKVFSCYRGWKKACQATRAILTTSRCELSSIIFFLQRQGAKGN